MRKQLRHLLLFAWRVGHSLRPWLEKERTQSATLDSLEEWKSALTALHLQFCITLVITTYYLTTKDIPKPDRLPSIPASAIHATSSLTPPPSPLGPSQLPSPMIMANSLPPTSPLAIGKLCYFDKPTTFLSYFVCEIFILVGVPLKIGLSDLDLARIISKQSE
jgi:hypothetical protein